MSENNEFDSLDDMFDNMRAARSATEQISTPAKPEKPEKPVVNKTETSKKQRENKPPKLQSDAAQPSKTAKTLESIEKSLLETKTLIESKFDSLNRSILDVVNVMSQSSPASELPAGITEIMTEDWEMLYRSNKKRFKPNTPLRDILERFNKMIKGDINNDSP